MIHHQNAASIHDLERLGAVSRASAVNQLYLEPDGTHSVFEERMHGDKTPEKTYSKDLADLLYGKESHEDGLYHGQSVGISKSGSKEALNQSPKSPNASSSAIPKSAHF